MTPTYDPSNIKMVWGGIIISGYADGTFVHVERASDSYQKVVGAGGEVMRTRLRDASGAIKFTLMPTSQCNDSLSAVAAQDDADNTGVLPLSIEDINGTTLLSSAHAWVKKTADVDFGKEPANREWTLECDVLNMFVGGTNTTP